MTAEDPFLCLSRVGPGRPPTLWDPWQSHTINKTASQSWEVVEQCMCMWLTLFLHRPDRGAQLAALLPKLTQVGGMPALAADTFTRAGPLRLPQACSAVTSLGAPCGEEEETIPAPGAEGIWK